MKPATVRQLLLGLLSLLHAAFSAAPNRRATVAVLRALISETQRVVSKLERSKA